MGKYSEYNEVVNSFKWLDDNYPEFKVHIPSELWGLLETMLLQARYDGIKEGKKAVADKIVENLLRV